LPARPDDPHAARPVLTDGVLPKDARAAVIMIHGRGAGAADILGLAQVIDRANIAWLAPEAANRTWYPLPFTAPTAANEPWLSSALGVVGRLVGEIEAAGLPLERIVLLGFSQGACLVSEYAARNPRRYGGVVALSGGLIGERIDPAAYRGSLVDTPVFFGCSDVDPHIPLARVQESTAVFRALGGDVTERIYAGAAHTVVADEIAAVQALLDAIPPVLPA
jgi:predicted esterase